MKLIINLLKFIGILAFMPVCLYLIIRFEPAEWHKNLFLAVATPTALALLCVVLICMKHFKKEQFTKVHFLRTIVFSLALAIVLHPLNNLIDCYGTDISDLSREGIVYWNNTTPLYTLLLAPLLEELGIRIVVINTFKGKLPNWILIIGTSWLFSFLHYSVVSTFVMGVILSFLFIQSGNGLLLILTHFFYNLFSLTLDLFNTHFAFLPEYLHVLIIVFVAALVVIILKRDKCKALLLSTVKLDIVIKIIC